MSEKSQIYVVLDQRDLERAQEKRSFSTRGSLIYIKPLLMVLFLFIMVDFTMIYDSYVTKQFTISRESWKYLGVPTLAHRAPES